MPAAKHIKYVLLRCPQPTKLRIVYMPVEVTMAAKKLVARAVQNVFSIYRLIKMLAIVAVPNCQISNVSQVKALFEYSFLIVRNETVH